MPSAMSTGLASQSTSKTVVHINRQDKQFSIVCLTDTVQFLKKPISKGMPGIIAGFVPKEEKVFISFWSGRFSDEGIPVSFDKLRVATHKEAIAFVTSFVDTDIVFAILVAHENGLSEELAQTLLQKGITPSELIRMRKIQTVLKLQEDPTIFVDFKKILEGTYKKSQQ